MAPGASNSTQGCFMALLHNGTKLDLQPNPDCNDKLPFICGYDNRVDYDFDPLDLVVTGSNLTFPEAVVECNALNRTVASIMNAEQQAVAESLANSTGKSLWVSAKYDAANQAYRWADNSYVMYSNWQDDVPRHDVGGQKHYCTTVNRSTGRWDTQPCDLLRKPALCGPPEAKKPLWFTPFYPVDGFRSVQTLKEEIRRLKREDYVCEKPKLMECSAKSKSGNHWVTNSNQNCNTIKCTENDISCKEDRELDCSTFRVRFLCPQEEDQCKELNKLQAPACGGGQVCSPAPNHYVCRCPPGSMYSKVSKKCVKFCGECYSWGDHHYSTLSGKRYDFMGSCKYKFSGVCNTTDMADKPNYDIYTTNVPCANISRNDATCLDTVEIHLRNVPVKANKKNFVFKVKVADKGYEINGKRVSEQVTVKDDVYKVVVRPHYFSLVAYAPDLKILLDGKELRVRVPDSFSGNLCGLCADCYTDQFTMRNGSTVDVPHTNGFYDNKAILPVALDWLERTNEFENKSCGVKEFRDNCSLAQKQNMTDANLCGIFKQKDSPLQKCFNSTNLKPQDFFINCIYDLCEMKDPQVAVCGIVSEFAQQCLAKGVLVDWRTPSFCPMQCPVDMVYRVDASCPNRCEDVPGIKAPCDEAPAEGCVCKDGLYLLDNKCVPKSQCGCQVDGNDGQFIKMLQPGQKLVMPGCREQVTCEKRTDGTLSAKYIDYVIPPNSVCSADVPPKITCARGFSLKADNKTCERTFETCAEGYKDQFGWCIQYPGKTSPWRIALSYCNNVDGTLVYVDTAEKITSVQQILEAKSWESMYIAGRVMATSFFGFVTFKSVLSGTEPGSVAWANYDFYAPFVDKLTLSPSLKASDIPAEGLELSVMAELFQGNVIFRAVPSDQAGNFMCLQRTVGENDTTWSAPCNTHTNMSDGGDRETRLSMLADPTCSICQRPMDVRCVPVTGSSGVEGTCGLSDTGLYYSCDQGNACMDKAVSVKCVKDADECATKRDDCPKNSTCVNTIGAFECKCPKEFPLMINGQCTAEKTCRMWRPEDSQTKGYNFELFSGAKTTFDKDCKFVMASVCDGEYKANSGLPYFSVRDVSVRPSDGSTGSKTMEVVAITIYNPANNASQTAVLTAQHLSMGTIYVGSDRSEIKVATLSYTDQSINTMFTLVTKTGWSSDTCTTTSNSPSPSQ
ncbi:hypothetical protein EGW08_021730 [Elysia chlorotica]|uniref:C-type lectin domain-containing protein n=1 Tax=Elysia chlorotica TaxID=188477 RepID=A0A433SMX2_ELYCH|nr:hypothetical protein EGW08_021730 [Elysia chlorotica]